MKEKLLRSIEKDGYRGQVVPIRYLRNLEENIETSHRKGLFDEVFYQERLTYYVFKPPENLSDPKSLIIVAVRRPQARFIFTWKGNRVPVIVPPTYLHWQKIDRQVEKMLAKVLEAEGYHVARAVLPEKLLAVQSGLAAYGRNNITYIPGMGSFHQLVAFYSDLPCKEDSWQEPRMMELCEQCRACIHHCPSGAITGERFLLRGERCIVYHNERPGHIPFPSWMKASWHNCLIGCMYCQNICPVNKEFLEWFGDEAEFTSKETELILKGGSTEQIPPEMAKKLEDYNLMELFDFLPRNLSVLIERTM